MDVPNLLSEGWDHFAPLIAMVIQFHVTGEGKNAQPPTLSAPSNVSARKSGALGATAETVSAAADTTVAASSAIVWRRDAC